MIYLDDRFPDHPKVVEAGDEAGWMFVAGLCYVNRNHTMGRIPKAGVARLTSHRRPAAVAAKLVAVNLWEERGDHYLIHDYEERNKTTIARSEHARKAAEARWAKETEAKNDDPPSDARASNGHMPEHDPGIDRASPEQCATDAASRAYPTRSQDPKIPRLSLSVVPTSPPQSPGRKGENERAKPNTDPVAGALAEFDGRPRKAPATHTPGRFRKARQLVDRMAKTLVNAGSKPQPDELVDCVLWSLSSLDHALVDEVIGQCAGLDEAPRTVSYFAQTIRQWAFQRGVKMPAFDAKRAQHV